MIFIACRSGDIIQAFIGLWLIPRYIGKEELGAVIPLQQITSLFAIPLSIIAIVFSKFVNTYATRGEHGKVKCFIRDVLITASLIFLICIVAARLVIPHFYERLRIASGSLTLLILAAGFTGSISQLFTNALQGLKQFNVLTIVNLISAPIRLVTLIVAMPFRALSGYILGQTTPSASTSIIAAFTLSKRLQHIQIDTTWRRNIPTMLHYLWPVAIYTITVTLCSTISATVYRQRLMEIESAAYYLISRLSEIAGYVGLSMMVVLFPIAAEAHEKGKEDTTPLYHTLIAIGSTSIVLSLVFAIAGQPLFNLIETWRTYTPYVNLLPWTTLIMGAGAAIGAITSYEMACRRFAVPFFIAIFSFLITLILVSFTGWEFYRGLLPDNIVDWMANHNLTDLTRITWLNGISAFLQIFILLLLISYRSHNQSKTRLL